MDLVTLGETMVLFRSQSPGPLRYAPSFGKMIGGAESNVCIALARLGHETGWISRLGDDEFGLFIRNTIRGEGVDTSWVSFDEEHATGLMFKEQQTGRDPSVYYYRKDSAASHMSPEDLDEAYVTRAKILHVTGITPALSPSCRETVHKAIDMAKRNGRTVVFDPNIRFKLWSEEDEARRTLLDIAKRADIVLPGMDEGAFLTGYDTPEEIASDFLQKGASHVVIKRGGEGAFYASEDVSEYVPAFTVDPIVDTVGAGDGFAAGVISGWLRNQSMKESVRLGHRVGAYALTVPGDVEGYPYASQIDPESEKRHVLR